MRDFDSDRLVAVDVRLFTVASSRFYTAPRLARCVATVSIAVLICVAHAQREIGLSLGEPPAMRGYPPSAPGLIPQLGERAGDDRDSSGSITAIYTVLADGGDLDDSVIDAARAIIDGRIILPRNLADTTDDDQRAAAQHFRKLWSGGD